MYWLWQRQPRLNKEISQAKKNDQVQSNTEEKNSTFDPKEGTVLEDAQIKLKGEVGANSYVAVYSNDYRQLTRSNDKGTFETGIELSDGLNIFEVSEYSQELKKVGNKTIMYYLLSAKGKLAIDTVYAGNAKNIFDNLLTIGTQDGEKKARASKPTVIVAPSDEEESKKEATASVLSGVRIGDYVIALGKKDKEGLLSAERIEILRENKPKANTRILATIIAGDIKSNLFRGKDEANKVLEFSIAKTTEVVINSQKGKNEDIKKDRKAIIFFEGGDKNIVLKIFLI